MVKNVTIKNNVNYSDKKLKKLRENNQIHYTNNIYYLLHLTINLLNK